MNPLRSLLPAGAALASVWLATAHAAEVRVIYTEIASSPTGVVPGALDSAGNPVATNWMAIEDVAIRDDGGQWIIKGRTTQGSTNDSILVLGSGDTGTMFAQDDQPFLGGVAGEKYDFFDTPIPATWDNNGRIAFSARAKGGVSGTLEKIVIVSGATHTIVVQQGNPAFGLSDIPANPTGDEEFGNSINSLFLLDNTNAVGFVNTPIQNCSSFRYPAMFIGNSAFRQSGVHTIAGEIWDTFDLDSCGGTSDGLHWFALGEVESAPTTSDGLLAVDDVIVIREGSAIVPGDPMTAVDIFRCRMTQNGSWFARGDDPNSADWAVSNGIVFARTGDPVPGAPGENWGDAFGNFVGNASGDWLITGSTTNADVNADNVLVLNGAVIAREGDGVDVDGNGMLDDDAFIASFQADGVLLGDDGTVHALVTLRDGTGASLGDGYLQIAGCPSAVAYGAGCAGSGGFVPSLGLTGCTEPGASITLSVDNGLGGASALLFLGLTQASVPMQGGCTLLTLPLPLSITLPLSGAGAGNGSFSAGLTIPASLSPVTVLMQAFVPDPGVFHGFSNTNGIKMAIQ